MSGKVSIPISADASSVAQAFEQIRAVIRRAGQEGVEFAKLDLSHPELKDMAAEIRVIQRNLDDLTRVARGTTAKAVREVLIDGGATVFGPGGLMEGFNRRFPDQRDRNRIINQAGG